MRIFQEVQEESSKTDEVQPRWTFDLSHEEMNVITLNLAELHDIYCRLLNGDDLQYDLYADDGFDRRQMVKRVESLAEFVGELSPIGRNRLGEWVRG